MIDSEIPKEIENSLIHLLNDENEENYEPTLFKTPHTMTDVILSKC